MSIKFLYRTIIVTIISFMILGSALVLSASSVFSLLKFDSYYHLFISHIAKVILAVGALGLFSVIPYDVYKEHSKKAVVAVVVLLILTLFIAPNIKGAGRWINLYLFSFQPAEIAKFVLIMHLAFLIESKGDDIRNYKKGFMFTLFWIFAIAALILIQPNVSTSVIIILVSFTLLFIGGAKVTHIVSTLLVVGFVAGVVAWNMPHSHKRIEAFINSHETGQQINTQVLQAKIGLGSGGIIGRGFGHSRQSDLFLPESYSDFIFSILGEEAGFVGTTSVILFYLVIFVFGVLIAKKAKDKFGQLLGFGISFIIILSAFINAAVVTGLFPTTGIPLPFISYGGTSIIFTCAAAGIIINIGIVTYKESLKKAPVKK